MKIQQITLLIALLFTFDGIAQDTGSGLDFLNIGASTRQLSVSEASSATLTGSSAIYSNPALLVLESKSSVDVSYTLWISNVENQFASVNVLKDSYALAFGVYSSNSNDFEARDQPGPSQGDFSITYLSISSAISYDFGPFSAGVTGQFLREEVFDFRANGFAFNGGLAAQFLDQRVRTGVTIRNVGEMSDLINESTTLPSTFTAGISADFFEFSTPGRNDLPVLLTLGAEFIQPLENTAISVDYTTRDGKEPFFAFSLAANITDLFYLNGGIKTGPTERPASFGAGIDIEPVRVNYALVPFSTGFGTVHSIGLQFYF